MTHYSGAVAEDKELAEKFLKVVKRFEGKGHIYKAVKME